MFYINNYNNNNDITNSEDTHNIVFGHTIIPLGNRGTFNAGNRWRKHDSTTILPEDKEWI